MDFTQEQISELLLRIANEKDGYRQLLKLSLEAIMKAERESFNDMHNDSSNGYRLSSVYAQNGKLELVVPRSRHHNFYPLILGLIKDQESESKEMAFELYKAGLTTVQVGEIFEKIYGHHYSKSAISQMMDNARVDVNSWLGRKLDSCYPVIYIDATYWCTRRDKSTSSEAYYTILGVKQDRTREVLAVINHPTEGASNWEEAFTGLKLRGVQEVQLVVCDGLAGIENVINTAFPKAAIQLCTVHLNRNVLAKVKPMDKSEIAKDFKEVLNPENPWDTQEDGVKRLHHFVDKWKKKYPSLTIYKGNRYHLYFTYLNYEVAIRRMIYTTNWIERLNRNYKRTLKMRAAMPSPESVIFLLGSVAMKQKHYNFPIYQFSLTTKLNFNNYI